MSIGLNKIGPENQKINPTAAINYRNSASRPPIPGSENTRWIFFYNTVMIFSVGIWFNGFYLLNQREILLSKVY